MAQGTTTVRVSRRAHQIFSDLAERRHSSVSDLLDRLAERERRQDILTAYNARVAELLEDPNECALWTQGLAQSEVSSAELADMEQHAALSR